MRRLPKQIPQGREENLLHHQLELVFYFVLNIYEMKILLDNVIQPIMSSSSILRLSVLKTQQESVYLDTDATYRL